MLSPSEETMLAPPLALRRARAVNEPVLPESDSREATAHWVDAQAGSLLRRVSEEAAQLDASGQPLRREVLLEAARCGLLGASLPRSVGGLGMSLPCWGRVLERVGYLCDDASFTLNISLFQAVANMLLASGNEQLIDRYVRPVCTGERLPAFAYTEDGDAFTLKSSFRAHGGDYLASGSKVMVTAGAMADSYMTYLRNDATGDMAVVMIDRDSRGLRVEPIATMGLRASGLAALHFDAVRVPREQVITLENGLEHVQAFLNPRRAMLCCAPVGRMQRIVDECARMLAETERYGAPLTSMQLVQARLGRMQMKTLSSRALVDAALGGLDAQPGSDLFGEAISTAKHQITEHAIAVALESIRLTGARGYACNQHLERYLRDFCGMLSGAGAQDVLEVNLGAIAAARVL
ncbi:acyl-CoA dehydrogenase family protein [Paucibacter sp. APW11]|uniref:Acyl-CoA dehydrogenase family protein n=1 Tax=Roseateles aquae TaxID=3077235 RepID=A0ABU3P571_9BURK|nr:acyl-CoA dehydrogenase family protein [Paucibacter sp. APW11]MDT8997723.1 acyl-CoA dehydrogenase family protein [Paucibacter sp. APW11]